MTGIILHNYPQSPVAEKVRVGLGIKGLAWQSVEIPRLPPKPMLTALTGGYRRTPVMQIGADVFCDSQCILRALERRFPEPSFFPTGSEGIALGLSRWMDGELFSLAVKLVLGAAGDALDPAFAADRGRLYLGPDWAMRLAEADRELPHLAALMRGHLGWMETRLSSGQDFLTGDSPGLADALAYHITWFLRGRWAAGPALLGEFPRLIAWEDRVAEIGHGQPGALSAAEAIEIARATDPTTTPATDPLDPQGLTAGERITVSPDLNGGEQAVAGQVHAVSREDIAILRDDPQAGTLCVHFPRVGYRVERAG